MHGDLLRFVPRSFRHVARGPALEVNTNDLWLIRGCEDAEGPVPRFREIPRRRPFERLAGFCHAEQTIEFQVLCLPCVRGLKPRC